MTNAAALATRYARRPLLLEPLAARELVQHLSASDPKGMRTESRLDAVLRKVGFGRPSPEAMADDGSLPAGPPCYSPLWAQQTYGPPEDQGFAWSLVAGAAMMEIDSAIADRGEMYCGSFYPGYDTILASMTEALADARVGGLFIRMASPGGVGTGGLPALAAFMRAARASGNAAGKPIHVYADRACSAAYWIAAQADRISAPAFGDVGSIGAVIVHMEQSGALAKEGVTVTAIQFGAEKTAFNWWEPLSASTRADLQADIDQMGSDFVADVALGRPKLTPDALIATQARVFMARHDDPSRSGLALGFIDAIETEQQAFAALLTAVERANTARGPLVVTQPAPEAAMTTPKTPKTAATRPRSALAVAAAALGAPEASTADVSAPAAPPQPAATAENDPCPTCEGSGEVAGEPCPDCGGSGVDPEAGPNAEAEAEPAAEEPSAEARAAADRDAILNSPEAKSHPHAAMAAIRDGLTLAQLKGQLAANATAAETAPRRGGALREAMAGARRLGPDGPKAEAGKGGLVAAAGRLRRPGAN